MNDFQIGDYVVLNSGSPRMLVNKIENDLVVCSWEINGITKIDSFDYRTLTLVREH